MGDEKPKFLDANKPDTWKKPEDTTWGDYMLRPDKPLSDRHRELARMLAHGKRNKDICEALGYTAGRVSVLKSSKKVMDAVEEYRDRLFGVDTATRIKELTCDALNVMGEILTSNIPVEDKEAAAKWILEKDTGKPAQQVDVRANVAVGVFMDKLDQMTQVGPVGQLGPVALPKPETIDIIPKDGGETAKIEEGAEAEVSSGFGDWLDQNF